MLTTGYSSLLYAFLCAVPDLAKNKIIASEDQPSGVELSFKVVTGEKKRKRKKKKQEQSLLVPFGEKKNTAHKKRRGWKTLQPVSQEDVVSFVGNLIVSILLLLIVCLGEILHKCLFLCCCFLLFSVL